MPSNDRRTFLKTVGVATGAVSLTGTGIALAQQDDSDANGSNDSNNADSSNDPAGWTTYHGNPGRTGFTADSGPETDVQTDWSMDLNGSMWNREPVVADGVLYLVADTSSAPSESKGYILAYDLKAGEEKWRRDDVPQPKTPTVGDEYVYFATITDDYPANDEGGLFALDRETGETKWHKTDSYEWENPVFVDGRLFAVDEAKGYGFAFDGKTGDIVWMNKDVGTEPCYADATVFYRQGAALNADDGTEKWRIEDENADFTLHAATADRVYGIRTDEYGIAVQGRSASDGTVKWAYRPGVSDDKHGRLAVGDGYVFLAEYNDGEPDGITVMDAETGELVWSDEFDMEITGDLTVADNALYVPGRTGVDLQYGDAVVLALSTAELEREWRYTFGSWDYDDVGPAADTPVVADGNVYTSTYPKHSTTYSMYIDHAELYVLGSGDDSSDDGSGDDGSGDEGSDDDQGDDSGGDKDDCQ
ncbi:outer membrane protein assembly factor BamB family protein [Haladaptatus caseinilyticus]|uniref:outer membrane protein assembly factor BamB family protein n=1 Tax=Haladaptatus caseinilyticus TaxID=2993314 RepID=UPI00224AE410|nr:PQQ-binding-like beta-propeller repeat protein [Haladaptatus caseinilyticus]